MARARVSSVPSVSLFPFLSILACLSGALVVMICVLTILQATTSGTTAAKSNPLALEMKELQKQLGEYRALSDQFTSIEEMQKRLVLLRDMSQGAETTDAIQARIQKEVENLQTVIANLQNDKPRLAKEIARLKEDLAERRINPAEMKAPLRVQGGGSGFAVGRRLFVVEANSDSVVVHRSKEDRFRVAAATIGADKDYNGFLGEVAQQKNHLVLFLVRVDGQNSYDRGAGWAEQQYKLATSKIPIPGQGKVDLSEFEKFMK
ncbi:MAG: hypothetical protein HZA92_07145 [Verrucomicrobia bacterium]|nr:hypothetical protein [Verrucomicrobiota bacterium]